MANFGTIELNGETYDLGILSEPEACVLLHLFQQANADIDRANQMLQQGGEMIERGTALLNSLEATVARFIADAEAKRREAANG